MRCTLVTDGASDRALIPILRWLLRQALPRTPANVRWAELRTLRNSPRTLADRIGAAVALYPCDLLFVHRDAESATTDERAVEIEQACKEAGCRFPRVAVIPVRMTEAWLLFDEAAIRRAAGNPQGKVALDLPPFHLVEYKPDPKRQLHEAIRAASELGPRRQKNLLVQQAVHRIAELIQDYARLRELRAFQRLEEELREVLQARGWS